MDSIFDTKPAPYRILHQTPTSEVYYCELTHQKIFFIILFLISVVACAMTRKEILEDWEWIFSNICETLHSFDNEEDITDFVTCKVESVIATRHEVEVDGKITNSFYLIQN